MAKKRVASEFDLIGAIKRIEERVGRIEEAIAKDHPLPAIVADERYRISELRVFGFKPGFLYKNYKHLIHNDGVSYMLGRDVSKINESAPTLALAPAAATAAVPRRRGRPRKDTKRSTDESTDDRTIDNRVVYVLRWHRCARYARKAA